ncbi:MAG: hypothetical protein ABTD50_07490 [Polyangiaceae bacterium]
MNGFAAVLVGAAAAVACDAQLAPTPAGVDAGSAIASSSGGEGGGGYFSQADASGVVSESSSGIVGGDGASSSSGGWSIPAAEGSSSSSGTPPQGSASSSGIIMAPAGSSSGNVASSSGPFSGWTGSSSGRIGASAGMLIDDMAGPENTTGGYWYTFSDREVPYSEPAVLQVLPDAGMPPGMVLPLEGAAFNPSPSQTVLADGTSAYFREFQAAGETTWGAGFGMDFTDVPPSGQPIPFNACNGAYDLPDGSTDVFDVSADATGRVAVPLPFDASEWTGVQFWAASVGPAAPTVITINIDDDQTSPWGGVCGACVTVPSVTPPYECSNSWAMKIGVSPLWTLYLIPFAEMRPDSNWNSQGLKAGGIHTNKLYNLHWKFETVGVPLPPVDVRVAMVEFYQ